MGDNEQFAHSALNVLINRSTLQDDSQHITSPKQHQARQTSLQMQPVSSHNSASALPSNTNEELGGNMREFKDLLTSVKEKECNVRSLGLGCDRPELFVQCQWQQKKDSVSIIYLIYRILHAFFFVFVMGWSLRESARSNTPEENYLSKWLIYLTNWGFTLCTVQAVVSLGLLVHQVVKQSKNKDSQKSIISMSIMYKVYWVLHTTAVVVALGITGAYFVVEYSPDRYALTAINLMIHAFNSVLMVIDLLVVSHPFRLLHCYWPFCFTVLYFCFSLIYFLAGGTSRGNIRYIYPALDWEKPGITLLTILGGLLYILLAHFLMWLLVLGRNKLGNAYLKKYSAPANNQVQPA